MAKEIDRIVDIGVWLGVIPEPFPAVEWAGDFEAEPADEPVELIEGVLHQGCKMVLGGTSKSNKSWCLLDMALSVATGLTWWGRRTRRARVLYANFELPAWAVRKRLGSIREARPELRGYERSLGLWNLRGRAANFSQLRPELERMLDREEFGLIIIDPVYKLLGDRDENANSDIADLMNEFEKLACRTEAAVVLAHHFAKGNSSTKEAIDRISGAGAWGRDPDSIMVMTPHEEEECFTVTSILRHHAPTPEFVVRWEFPLLRRADELDPAALRTPQTKNKAMTDGEFAERYVRNEPQRRKLIVDAVKERDGLGVRTVERYLQRLVGAGKVACGGGLYWLAEPAGDSAEETMQNERN
jgi:hypothetical protein